jgi:hypothetical protein
MPQRTTAAPSWEERKRVEGGRLLKELKEVYAVTPGYVFSMDWVDDSKSTLELKGRDITVEVYATSWGGEVSLFARGFQDSQGDNATPYFRHHFPGGPETLLNFMKNTVFH